MFNKEVTWLKINKWAINLFWCLSNLYLYHHIQEPMIELCMNIFDHQVFYVQCERMPGLTSARMSLDLKKFSNNILKCIVLQFWWKLSTCRIVKTCPFCFLCDYYGDSLDVMFPQFPNHFLPFPMVFSHVSSSVSMISSGVSTVSPQCFPCSRTISHGVFPCFP